MAAPLGGLGALGGAGGEKRCAWPRCPKALATASTPRRKHCDWQAISVLTRATGTGSELRREAGPTHGDDGDLANARPPGVPLRSRLSRVGDPAHRLRLDERREASVAHAAHVGERLVQERDDAGILEHLLHHLVAVSA